MTEMIRSSRLLAAAAIASLAIGGASVAIAQADEGHGTHGDKPAKDEGGKKKGDKGKKKGKNKGKKAKQSTFMLEGMHSEGAYGMAYLSQKGKKVTGMVMVAGIEPGMHAMHLHGPKGTCTAPASSHAIDFPDLMADENGVAFAEVEERAKAKVIKKGYHLNVHQNPTDGDGGHMPMADGGHMPGSNPVAACGNVK